MKPSPQMIVNILILAMLGVCAYLLFTRKNGNTYGNIIHEYNQVDSSSVVNKYNTQQATQWVKDTIRIPIPADVDTMAILRDYYTKKVSVQEYRDSSLYAKINDTIFMNGIASRSFEYKILRPTKTVEVLPVPKLQVYAGAMMSKDLAGINATGVIKGRYMVGIGYDLRGKSPFFSAGIKIK